MAVAPPTPNRFGNTLQHSQMLYGNHDDMSMVDTLPSIDFGFDELRERMSAFTMRFDDFIARGRRRVLEEKNAFRMGAAEIIDAQRARRQAILDFETKSNNHAETVAKEAQEIEELHAAIASLQAQKEQHTHRKAELEAQVQTLQHDVKERREAQSAYHKALEIQARQDIPELHTWERLLGMSIHGTLTGSERLRFMFATRDRRTDEVWFEMDLAGERQKVTSCQPELDQSMIDGMESRLTEDRDMTTFLKSMRQQLLDGKGD